jgi:hypothetical protein
VDPFELVLSLALRSRPVSGSRSFSFSALPPPRAVLNTVPTPGPVLRRPASNPSGLKLPIGLVLVNEPLDPLSLSHEDEDEEVRVADLPRRSSCCGGIPFSEREGASSCRPLAGSEG